MKLATGSTTGMPTVGVVVRFVAGGLLLGEAVRVQALSVAFIAALGIEASCRSASVAPCSTSV